MADTTVPHFHNDPGVSTIEIGTNEAIGARAEPLVEAIPGARALLVPDGDHMRTVGDKTYEQCVLEFMKTIG